MVLSGPNNAKVAFTPMRALILTNSPVSQTDIPRLADEQIIAGPAWPDAQDLEGRWLSLRAPTGVEELDVVLSKIPHYQWPDQIVILEGQETKVVSLESVTHVPMAYCA
jgi:hypothetical protein